MIRRSRFSNQVLIGLFSLGFVGVVAAQPSTAQESPSSMGAPATQTPNSSAPMPNGDRTPLLSRSVPPSGDAVNFINSPSSETDRDGAIRSPRTLSARAIGTAEDNSMVSTTYTGSRDRQASVPSYERGVTPSTANRSVESSTNTGNSRIVGQTPASPDSDSVNTIDQPTSETNRDGAVRSPETLNPGSGQSGMQSGDRSAPSGQSSNQSPSVNNDSVNTIDQPTSETNRDGAVRSPETLNPGSSSSSDRSAPSGQSSNQTSEQSPSVNNDSVNTVDQPTSETNRDGAVRSPATLDPSSTQPNSTQSDDRSMPSGQSSNQSPNVDNDSVNTIDQPTSETNRDGAVRSPETLSPGSPQSSDRNQTGTSQSQNTSGESVSQLVSDNSSYSTLATAVQAAGLENVLATQGPLTLFAPTNEAFEALPPETLQRLLEPQNRQVLRQVLAYHLVPGSYPSADIQAGEVETAAGAPVEITTDSSGVTVGGASVVEPDITGSNGVIHGIDRVLLPPNLQLQ